MLLSILRVTIELYETYTNKHHNEFHRCTAVLRRQTSQRALIHKKSYEWCGQRLEKEKEKEQEFQNSVSLQELLERVPT
jgi:uncharacterized protein YqgQ